MIIRVLLLLLLLILLYYRNKSHRKPRHSTEHVITAKRVKIAGSSRFNHCRCTDYHRFRPAIRAMAGIKAIGVVKPKLSDILAVI
jgi:hypothetical protein